MPRSYLHSPIKAAAVLYSQVYCGQQNGGHANHRVCLLIVGAEERKAREGGDFGASGSRERERVAGSRLWGGGSLMKKMEGGCLWRGYYLRRGGRLVLGGTINDGEEGGSLSAFVNMCLSLGHLHRAVRASIC